MVDDVFKRWLAVFAAFVALYKAGNLPLPTRNRALSQVDTRPPLPQPLIAGYANWGQCNDKIVQAAEDGVNLVIWFSINLQGISGRATITGPATGEEYLDCVASKVARLKQLGLSVRHMVSIGGWNSPHPDKGFTARTWWREWKRWNAEEVAR
eukprot:gene20728-28955_t